MPASSEVLRCAAALSTAESAVAAIQETCASVRQQLGGPPDLAVVFLTPAHGPDFAPLLAELCDRLGTDRLIGCTGESIAGGDREIEEGPALSLWAARFGATEVVPLRLNFERTTEGGTFTGWPAELPETWPSGAALLLLGEPYSFPADELLRRLNEDQPGAPVLGGMASGGHAPRENKVFLGRNVFEEGAVGVWVHGAVRVRSVVSQGCRPVGRTFIVTKGEQNVIRELSGQPAMQQLQQVFGELTPEEQQMVRRGLHVGQVISEYRDKFSRGDFLVRNVVGADPNSGAIAIGDFIRIGQTVQFHIRDAASADEDLRELLARGPRAGPPLGALLFTCNGRGTRLFPEPNHDAGCVRMSLGEIPLAGFFAQGEIGPIAGQNFLHGFTASVAVFENPGPDYASADGTSSP